ncbi:contact-dependent growth inhibition system immunity protein [Streptomyces sp. NBC_01762]|uniref:contact-dependent growth inhibition system immunity protein n=1 Tax=unclassified Streptomyces TaxID=2593676 RepID=UPI002DDAEB2C|nr:MULTISPECIES: contact-dependent growth inhibition system immunity protein [unclassified Streptomyces]WSC49923.1 contact-dependent growth inhibition system immunity protein [Streptomyces sp. NBC_01762]WSC51315.1 contact-dependent growth inhibition system immunity protein [Streptomyces sp. NBC_01761]
MVTVSIDRSRSLEELERDRWQAPPLDATYLIATAHALRSRPVGTLTVEDLRLLIGQDIGLPVLLPLALEVLRDNPLAEGHMYEGDLLRAVLTRNSTVWSAHPELARQLTFIVGGLSDLSPDLRSAVERFVGAVQNS